MVRPAARGGLWTDGAGRTRLRAGRLGRCAAEPPWSDDLATIDALVAHGLKPAAPSATGSARGLVAGAAAGGVVCRTNGELSSSQMLTSATLVRRCGRDAQLPDGRRLLGIRATVAGRCTSSSHTAGTSDRPPRCRPPDHPPGPSAAGRGWLVTLPPGRRSTWPSRRRPSTKSSAILGRGHAAGPASRRAAGRRAGPRAAAAARDWCGSRFPPSPAARTALRGPAAAADRPQRPSPHRSSTRRS